ncbi:uncharacterized protein LOC128653647 [Bombina bombina]|uniref:uncharacterized protein LOC128653647 n=1 Tax=Bombina bombina TaxID=8345 RepID=UPI00235A9462|nr:uncharacterized protein LOC128653647 [Bombina bombina]
MATAGPSTSRRTLLEMCEEEVEELMRNFIQQRNSENSQIDVSQADIFDPIVETVSRETDTESNSDSDSDSSSNEDNDRLDNLSWCRCGNCKLMPTVIESICCRENDDIDYHIPDGKSCICEHPFHIQETSQQFLDRVNSITYSYVPMRPNKQNILTQRGYRKLAYRGFSTWMYGDLGPNRIEDPYLPVWLIAFAVVSRHQTIYMSVFITRKMMVQHFQ